MGKQPIQVWRDKLAFLQCEEAAVSDPAQKFTLREQIEEARQKIAELEAANTTTTDSSEEATQRVLASYHRTVKQAWDERWAEGKTDDAAGE